MENNLELVREVENALHVDIIPGTEIMAQDGVYLLSSCTSLLERQSSLHLATFTGCILTSDSGRNPFRRERIESSFSTSAIQ
jgi:hypothetical protein